MSWIFALILVGAGAFALRLFVLRRVEPTVRLNRLAQQELAQHEEDASAIELWRADEGMLKLMEDKLGRAGFRTSEERRRANFARLGFLLVLPLTASAVAFVSKGVGAAIFAAFCGVYCGLTCWLYYLRFRTQDLQREMLFQLPLALEGLILLVESGLGILPAIEKMVAAKERGGETNPIVQIMRLVYQLSAHGLPFAQAVELVGDSVHFQPLRHVLLHLDISNAEGGQVVPSLRSLSDYAHNEWRLSVQTRVRRLENLVVFPVFASVMGLMLLTAAVPLVPVLNFMDGLQSKAPAFAQADAAYRGGER